MTDKKYWLTEWHIMNALKLIDRINKELSKDVVQMYILKKVFKRYVIGKDTITFEYSAKGIIGVIPVFRSLELLNKQFPNEEWIEIEELK